MKIENELSVAGRKPVTLMPDGPQGAKITLAIPEGDDEYNQVRTEFTEAMNRHPESDRKKAETIIAVANQLEIPIID